MPGQLIAPSFEVTLPLPVPAGLTKRVNVCRLKLAVTARAVLMVTLQVVPGAASQPLQKAKVEPEAGVAVRVTTVPLL